MTSCSSAATKHELNPKLVPSFVNLFPVHGTWGSKKACKTVMHEMHDDFRTTFYSSFRLKFMTMMNQKCTCCSGFYIESFRELFVLARIHLDFFQLAAAIS